MIQQYTTEEPIKSRNNKKLNIIPKEFCVWINVYKKYSKENLRKLYNLIFDDKIQEACSHKNHMLKVFKEKYPDLDPGEPNAPNKRKEKI